MISITLTTINVHARTNGLLCAQTDPPPRPPAANLFCSLCTLFTATVHTTRTTLIFFFGKQLRGCGIEVYDKEKEWRSYLGDGRKGPIVGEGVAACCSLSAPEVQALVGKREEARRAKVFSNKTITGSTSESSEMLRRLATPICHTLLIGRLPTSVSLRQLWPIR